MGMCKVGVDDDDSVGVWPIQDGWMLLDTLDFLVLTPTHPHPHTHNTHALCVHLLLDSTTVDNRK